MLWSLEFADFPFPIIVFLLLYGLVLRAAQTRRIH